MDSKRQGIINSISKVLKDLSEMDLSEVDKDIVFEKLEVLDKTVKSLEVSLGYILDEVEEPSEDELIGFHEDELSDIDLDKQEDNE